MHRFMVLALGFIILATASLAGVGDVQRSPNETGPSSAGAFNMWLLSSSDTSALQFAAFQGLLEEEGVAGIVPTWQLWRADAQYASRCGTAYFAQPPRERWREIIPTLKLLRDEVIPITGPLDVVSGYRTSEVNECVNGASRSKHLSFAALDLVASERSERKQLFTDLCALQARVGSARNMGLGAYYDPDDTLRNLAGRFHIDASGNRTWGHDYTGGSSPCGRLS